jgi:hypothetical protein
MSTVSLAGSTMISRREEEEVRQEVPQQVQQLQRDVPLRRRLELSRVGVSGYPKAAHGGVGPKGIFLRESDGRPSPALAHAPSRLAEAEAAEFSTRLKMMKGISVQR